MRSKSVAGNDREKGPGHNSGVDCSSQPSRPMFEDFKTGKLTPLLPARSDEHHLGSPSPHDRRERRLMSNQYFFHLSH